jgi:M6 family metalloprotease-like protein
MKIRQWLGMALAALGGLCMGSTCNPQTQGGPCTSGLDVRDIDDSAIPQGIKNTIYYQPGPTISKHMPGDPSTLSPQFPSGKVVVIPFETPDYPRNPAVTTSYLTQVFFAGGTLSGRSVYHYFRENSWGQFNISNGGVANWVTLGKDLVDYLGFEGEDDLPRDVLEQANINWEALDTNGDRTVTPAEAQIVFVVSNGYSAATRGFLNFPANWQAGDPVPPAVDPLQVNTPAGTYNFKPRVVYIGTKTAADPTYSSDAIRILSSICHELCHAFFNLPDRYAGPCGTGWTGEYDMMSNNCQWLHMTMHDKMKIGWIQPKIVAAHLGECLAFPNSESEKAALVLVQPGATLSADEYWIVENRYKKGSNCDGCVINLPGASFDQGVFDTGLPESGLAIWWVRTGTWFWGDDEVRLVDASLDDQDPNGNGPAQENPPSGGYRNQGAGALFKRNDADPQRLLLNSAGEWSSLYFRDVSDPGATMYGEF